jgi:hypothetical protein
MALRIRQIVLDAADPLPVARFWAALLGWPLIEVSDGWVALSDGTISIGVQRAPGHVPPRWPSSDRPQQVHLDIPVDDIDAMEALILDAGATKLAERPEDDPPFRIYADPAGHPFCLEYERSPAG